MQNSTKSFRKANVSPTQGVVGGSASKQWNKDLHALGRGSHLHLSENFPSPTLPQKLRKYLEFIAHSGLDCFPPSPPA
jgi:succinylglutamate desuccinylase